MPLVRVSLRKGTPPDRKAAVCDGIYDALRATFGVPEEDKFILVTEHAGEDFVFSRSYLDIPRSDDLVVIQITVSNTRSVDQKKALFQAVADRLAAAGLRREDVFINLIEVVKENWSFGNGIAQYA